MTETQYTIGDWAVRTFGPPVSSRILALRALEEMIELCIECGASKFDILRYMTVRFDEGITPSGNIAKEVADTIITLYNIAHFVGFSTSAEIDKAMSINRSRRWKSHGDGTGHHIKE